MSITYEIKPGDTLESIARKVYGYESEAYRILKANPGVSESLTGLTSLVVPNVPGNISNPVPQVLPANDNEVSVIIDGIRFRFWDSLRLVRTLDSIDTVELSAPFDPDSAGMKSTFRPFSYKDVLVYAGSELLFTGTMVAVNPVVEPARKTINAAAYSLPGVLHDCTASASAFPVEYDNLTIRGIVTDLLTPFGLSVEFLADIGAIFERVKLEPTKKLLPFITELASQRNLVTTNNEDGALIFQRSTEIGNPVAVLSQGSAPILSVTPEFRSQEFYSHVTGISPVTIGQTGSQFTVKNPRLDGVTRPLNFLANDSASADLKTSTETKAGRMFGSIVSYSVQLATWRDPSGALWAPNTTVILSAPGAMVYTDYEFIVRSVEFERVSNRETAILNLVLPGAFSGEIPESLPWDG